MTVLVIGVLAAGAFLVLAVNNGGSVSGKLTALQIATYAALAGFAGDDLVTAVAIALAESGGGNPRAYNPETAAKGGTPTGMGSYGLWQIYLKVHPEFQGIDLYDPQENASAAYHVYLAAGSSFRPWSTFTNNSYVTQLDAAQGAVNA